MVEAVGDLTAETLADLDLVALALGPRDHLGPGEDQDLTSLPMTVVERQDLTSHQKVDLQLSVVLEELVVLTIQIQQIDQADLTVTQIRVARVFRNPVLAMFQVFSV